MILNIVIRRFHHRIVDQNIFQTGEDRILFNKKNYKCIKICKHVMFDFN